MPEIYKKDQKYNIIYSDQDGKDNEYKFTPEEDMSKPEMIMKCKEANKNFIKLKEIKKLEEGVHKMEETKKLETLADIIRDRYEKGLDGLDVGDNTVDMIVYFDYNPEDLDNSVDTFTKCLDTIATGTKVVNYDEEGAYAVVDFYNYVIDHLNAFTGNFTINIDPADGEDNETIAANIVEGILPGLISGYTNDHTYNSLDTDLLMGVQKKEESFEDSKKFMAGEILAIIDNYINSDDIPNLFNRMGITQEIYEGDEEIPEGKIQDIVEIGLQWLFDHLQDEDYRRILKDELEMTDAEMEKYGVELDESKEVKTESGNYGGLTKEEIEAELEKYENQGFDVHQISQIQYGLEAGLDVSKYADPKLGFLQMQEIRLGLLRGVDVSEYVRSGQFDTYQLDEIIYGLAAGVDVSKYANPEFNEDKMEEIRKGLENGVDVSKYDDPKYNASQMEQIRVGLEAGLDVSKYADPKLKSYQMRIIREGLKDDVDITPYMDYKSTVKDLESIKYALTHGFIPKKAKK